ncbi:MAG: hypothetical protein PHT40_04495 [Patescibacteria group bacterium]|nr:hypothetical protein [Patescibacteria group bacterium]
MMKRIWLKVDGIQPISLYLMREQKVASLHLKVGKRAFTIHCIHLGFEESIKKNGVERVPEHVSQNWSAAHCGLQDVPIVHQGKRRANILLSHVLAKAVHAGLLSNDGLKSFLKGEGDTPYWPFLGLMADKPGSLRIPVEFISLHCFECGKPNGPVRANILVGHHLNFRNIQIFDGKKIGYDYADNTFQDERIIGIINKILARKSARKFIRQLSALGYNDHSHAKFTESISGYDPDKEIPPTIRFY